jgi:imidazolonepropionase-like amidohydrolase
MKFIAGGLIVAACGIGTAMPVVAQGPIAIDGATVHTVSGPVIEDGTVLIRDGLIVSVGRNVEIPADAVVIDGRGKVLTPGFMESKTNLGLAEVGLAPGTQDFMMVVEDNIAAAFNVLDGINPNSVVFAEARRGGVLTAITQPGIAGISAPGGPVHLVSGQGVLIDLVGGDLDAMTVSSPVAMFAVLGEGSQAAGGGARAGATLRLRELLDDARAYSQHRAEYERGDSRPFSASRLQLEAMIPVVTGELPLVVTAHRASDIRSALRIADEFDLDLIVAGAAEGWMVADELARAGVPVVAKVLSNLPASFEMLGARYDNVGIMRARGVKVAITTEDTHNARNLRQEAGNAVLYGMPWAEALRAITLSPAEIWDVADAYGSIEAGKRANLILWDGDPFEFMTRAERIIVQGRDLPPTSRQTELRDRYMNPDSQLRAYPRR